MFRKIRSNRDPGDTLVHEIKKEFHVYFEYAEGVLTAVIERHPRRILSIMVILMLLSFILSFTVFRHEQNGHVKALAKEVQTQPPSTKGKPNGFEDLLETTSALRQTLDVRKEVESLLAKPKLTTADSAELVKALDRLGQLQQHINHTP